jgi:hypothetical protein
MRRKTIVRGVAVVAALAMLAWAATAAYGAFFAGTYAGRITGVQGVPIHQKGGNMKFKITGSGKVSTFQFSKIFVACQDGNIHRASIKVRRTAEPIKHRVFTIHASSSTATLKVKGVIRGRNHARGYLRLKGQINTIDAGTQVCNSGRQFWSAGHVRGT